MQNMKLARLARVDSSSLKEIRTLVKQLSPHASLPDLARLRRIIKSRDVELWVVRDGKKIIGMGTLATAPVPTSLHASIEDVVVDKMYRGQGLGRRIVQTLIKRARARGARHVGLTSRPDRAAANTLYKKLGFKIRNNETNVYRLELRKK